MDPRNEYALRETRRYFLGQGALGIGGVALASLLNPQLLAGASVAQNQSALAPNGIHGALEKLHFPPKAKRVIYLSMNGAPSQLDLFDYKPKMAEHFDKDLPDSIRQGQRLTTMSSGQARFPIAPSIYKFAQYGKTRAWVSELLPHTAQVVDELTIVKSMYTEAINHDPAVTFLLTGSELPGRPSFGAWVSYGLGAMNENLPSFVVLHSRWSAKRDAQAVFNRQWGAGFLPSQYQGVGLRSSGDPVLYLSNPPGVSAADRRRSLDALAQLNQQRFAAVGDPEISTRIAQYEMAFRMQTSVPEFTDLSGESAKTFELYGPESRSPGSFAANCLLARRLAERNVRFIQIFHRNWDQHGDLPRDLPLQCRDVDQACRALIIDLKQRGLLDDTLVIWAGEFGRTIYCQGTLTKTNYGRDHHPRCFTIWMAGGGMRRGLVYGETDDFGYNITENPVHVHDLNATLLYCLGIDHTQLTYRFQGRDFRLTDVFGKVVKDILA
jgi:hypothetical protein